MLWKEGDVYKCPDPQCGCEVKVTKTPAPGTGGDIPPHCCFGEPMVEK